MSPNSPSPAAGDRPVSVPKPSDSSGSAPSGRLASIDAFRGFVMFLLLAEWLKLPQVAKSFPKSELWALLSRHQQHVEWVGCSLHDLIQPSFSFLVGVALPFSIASRLARGPVARPGWRATRSGGRSCWSLLGIFLRSMGKDADELHVRGHADPDRPGLRLPVPARASTGARPVGRAGGDPGRLLGGVRALSAARARLRLRERRRPGGLAAPRSAGSPRTGTRTATWPGRSTPGS